MTTNVITRFGLVRIEGTFAEVMDRIRELGSTVISIEFENMNHIEMKR